MSVTANLSDSMCASSKNYIHMVCGNDQPLYMYVSALFDSSGITLYPLQRLESIDVGTQVVTATHPALI